MIVIQSGMLKNQVFKSATISDSDKTLSNSSLPIGNKQPMTKILLIEDEEPVRENILELLEAEGFEAYLHSFEDI